MIHPLATFAGLALIWFIVLVLGVDDWGTVTSLWVIGIMAEALLFIGYGI